MGRKLRARVARTCGTGSDQSAEHRSVTATIRLGRASLLVIAFGWSNGATFAIYPVGGVTGAHINPAITLGAAIRKQLPWNKVGPYWVVQVAGAFVGAALVFLVYNNAINHYDQ